MSKREPRRATRRAAKQSPHLHTLAVEEVGPQVRRYVLGEERPGLPVRVVTALRTSRAFVWEEEADTGARRDIDPPTQGEPVDLRQSPWGTACSEHQLAQWLSFLSAVYTPGRSG